MFDIGFQELLLIGVLSLLIMGPERLPGAVRTATLWISRLRRSFLAIKADIEREVGVDELKQQIHNETIMKSLEQTKKDVEQNIQLSANNIKPELDQLHKDINDIVEPDQTTADDDNSDSNNHSHAEQRHEPSSRQ